MATHSTVHEYLAPAEHHMKAHEPLQRQTVCLNVHTAGASGWPDWHQEARRLEMNGKAVLSCQDTYGANPEPFAAPIG